MTRGATSTRLDLQICDRKLARLGSARFGAHFRRRGMQTLRARLISRAPSSGRDPGNWPKSNGRAIKEPPSAFIQNQRRRDIWIEAQISRVARQTSHSFATMTCIMIIALITARWPQYYAGARLDVFMCVSAGSRVSLNFSGFDCLTVGLLGPDFRPIQSDSSTGPS